MILTTALTIGDEQFVEHRGIVSGEVILGSSIFQDFIASLKEQEGKSASYGQSLQVAKETAMREMVEQARALGANAIIAVDIDFETINTSSGDRMLMVAVSGTAVRCE